MSKVPEGYVAIPFIEGQGPDEAVPTFGKVAGQMAMTLTLYVDRARAVQEATALVPYTLGQAATIFGLIYRLTAAGFPMEESELCSLAELCQRGLQAVADKEGEAIAQMDVILRSALAYQAKQEPGQ